MNTSFNKIENVVRHLANKMNIKIDKVRVEFSPSYEYAIEDDVTETTNNIFAVTLTLSNPSIMTQEKAKKFIATIEGKFSDNKHYKKLNEVLYIYFDNFEVECEEEDF